MSGLKYISWADNTGYGVAAKAFVSALVDAGVPVTWVPMLWGSGTYEPVADPQGLSGQLAAAAWRQIDYDTVLIHTIPENFGAWIGPERAAGKRVFGYTVFELDRLPDHWPAILNQLDGVLVPCTWNVGVFRRSGVTVPIHVVPHLPQFDAAQPSPADRTALQARLAAAGTPDRFVFYTIGHWSNRKAQHLVLEAFLTAFSNADAVSLVIKTGAKDITRQVRTWRSCFRRRYPSPETTVAQLVARRCNHPPVATIATETLSDGEMLALHERGDCYVSLTRSEGWGLGAFDAARLGRPVVMTGYGGQRDFLDPALSYIVDYQMVPANEPAWAMNYRPGDEWAAPSVAQAAAYMRAIYEAQSEAKARAVRQATQIRERFSSDRVLRSLLTAVSLEHAA